MLLTYFVGALVVTYAIALFFNLRTIFRILFALVASIGGVWLIVDHLATDAQDYFWFGAALLFTPIAIVAIEAGLWTQKK